MTQRIGISSFAMRMRAASLEFDDGADAEATPGSRMLLLRADPIEGRPRHANRESEPRAKLPHSAYSSSRRCDPFLEARAITPVSAFFSEPLLRVSLR